MLKIRANKKLTFPKGLDPEIVWCKCRYFREVNIWINQFPELPAIQAHFKSGSNYRDQTPHYFGRGDQGGEQTVELK